jgi:hypothetical protein
MINSKSMNSENMIKATNSNIAAKSESNNDTNSLGRVSYCSPQRYTHYKKTGSCFSLDDLRLLAKSYNSAFVKSTGALARIISQFFGSREGPAVPGQQQQGAHGTAINVQSASRLPPDQEHALLRNELRIRLQTDEYKWVDLLLDPQRNQAMYNQVQRALRPPLPKAWLSNSHKWLSTPDLENVMIQYEDAYPDFKFLGISPIDFDTRPGGRFGECVTDSLCNLSVKAMRRTGIRQFGTILNLDEHDEPGSHWVAIYGRIDDPKSPNYGVHYFDSVANDTPQEAATFMQRIAKELSELDRVDLKAVPCTSNDVQLQFKNTECGIFSMYFLACCVSGKVSVQDVWKAMAKDDMIHTLRAVFYRPPPEIDVANARKSFLPVKKKDNGPIHKEKRRKP